MKDQERVPRGRADAGQWRAQARDEADVELVDPSELPEQPWALDYEDMVWRTDPDELMSRRQRMKSRGPYKASIPPHVADLPVDVDPGTVTDSTDATAEIVRFDSETTARMRSLLGPDVYGDDAAGFTPLASVLLRTESASSSQIEQITAGARALALESIGVTKGRNAALVVSNADAMKRAIALADDISTGTVLGIHKALLNDSAPDIAGRFRDGPVWIGSGGSTPHTASFVPPRHERVPNLMEDLVEFSRRTDVPPLIHAAVAHAQFETIHPFPDGNGRVGRALVHAMLRSSGTTRSLTVPVSAGLLTGVEGYYEALGDYREGDLNPIVERFSVASFQAVRNGRHLVDDLAGTYEDWLTRVQARRGAAAWRALPHLLVQPAVTVQSVADQTNVSFAAAQTAVDTLETAQVLIPVDNRKRGRVWVATEITTALDAFAERAGRRRVVG